MEVIYELTSGYLGSPAKRLKTFVPPGMVKISDPMISKFISKIQVHLNHISDIIVGAQAIISLLKINIGDAPEYHTAIWCAMGDIMKKLVSHGTALENIDLYSIMKEARDSHLLTMLIKTSVDDSMAQAMPESAKVGSISANLTQLVTPGAGGRLNSMHHTINMIDKNIGV